MAAYDADVGVVGVGTVGAMTCWQLARRGASVVGFEQFAPGHDRAGAGGESRLFRTAYLEGAQYVPLLLAAQRLWRELEAETGHDLLTLNGGLMIGAPDGELLTSVRASIHEHDLPHRELDHDEASATYPQHRLRPGEAMILDEQAGFLRPELAVTVAGWRAETLGARIVRHQPVLALEPDTDGVTVVTADRTWRVRELVLAAGAWSRRLLPHVVPPLAVQRLVMTWFPARDPAEFAVDRFPIFIRHSDGFDISGWPTLDATSVKVAVNYGYDQVPDPDLLDRTVDDRLLGVIRAAVAEQLPGLFPEPVRVGAYMDGYTSDHHAVVGPAPAVPHTFLACGFSGHGFKMSPAVGAAVADQVLEGGTTLPVAHLTPGRPLDDHGLGDLRTVMADLATPVGS
ncbi:MAG: N-methyl-L-tryptophan oxidase [Nocardioidaceae bacterium]|nr:N-methyl-L-tryptophan oxidase [Nocardioidaceae bacterium]